MFRQELSAPGLYRLVRQAFQEIDDPRQTRHGSISYVSALLSAAAMFAFKAPSLLAFEKDVRRHDHVQGNLKRLFHIDEIPCDTTMREIIDAIPTDLLLKPFKRIFAAIQRGKDLEPFVFLDGHYLVALDGTGFFSSPSVHCDHCCVKTHRNGNQTYYHQAVAGVVIHPGQKVVIPLAPEPIVKQDGSTKNDCEREASRRFLERLRREHPHLKVIITEDGLASNAPHIELLHQLDCHYILGCKPGDHTFLFEFIEASEKLGVLKHVTLKGEKATFTFRYMNEVLLNGSSDVRVNYFDCTETRPDGTRLHFSWVTDIPVTESTVYTLMKGGRARWKIENETFNTLKNQGYQFEHNFGHGQQFLSNNLMVLMMMVFLIDQTQWLCCKVYQQAKEKAQRFSKLWELFRGLMMHFELDGWETLLRASAFGYKKTHLDLDTG